jgi:hypothetical protein
VSLIIATAYVLPAMALPVSVVFGLVAFVLAERGHRPVARGLGLVAVALPLLGWLVQELFWAGIL